MRLRKVSERVVYLVSILTKLSVVSSVFVLSIYGLNGKRFV